MGSIGNTSVRFAPRLPDGHFSRSRLQRRLDDAVEHRLVIVRGGAGVGKSAALAEWASGTRRDGIWVSVDDSLRHRTSLWRHVLRLVRGPDRARPAPHLDVADESELRLAVADELSARRSLVLFDNYHRLIDAAVHDDIEWLASSAGCTVVVATRTQTELESLPRQLRLDPVVIATDELVFTADETQQLLRARHTISVEDAERVHDSFAGWPLAVGLFDAEVRRRGDALPLDSAIAAVESALASEQSSMTALVREADTVAALCRLSHPDWLTPELASTLLPEIDVRALLARLESDGFGYWHERSHGRVFSLAPFVRAAVQPAWNAMSRLESRELRRLYAAWADRHAHSVIAGREAVHLNDWELLSDIAQRHFLSLIRVHRPEWRDLLAHVPLDKLRQYPVLGSVALLLLNAESGSTDRLRALTVALINSFGPLRDHGSTIDRIWRNASTLATERIAGRYAAAALTADRLVTLVSELDVDEHRAIADFLPVLHAQIGTSRLYVGDVEGGLESMNEAVHTSSTPSWPLLHALSMLALCAADRGEIDDAVSRTLDIETTSAVTGWYGTYSAAGYHLALAHARIEEFDVEGAKTELAVLDRHFDTIEHWPFIVRARALIGLIEGTPVDAAAQLVESVRARSRRSPTSPAMRAMLAAVHAELLIAAGDLRKAEQVLSRRGGPSLDMSLAEARWALAAGQTSRALTTAARVRDAAGAHPRHRSGALLVSAVAHDARGHVQRATDAVVEALHALRRTGLRTPLALVPRSAVLKIREHLTPEQHDVIDVLLAGAPELVTHAAPSVRLTAREAAVLGALANEARVTEIAAALYVSPNTVKTQLRTLYRKLGVSSRDDALAAASAAGLIETDTPRSG